jgi:hypothetical protein
MVLVALIIVWSIIISIILFSWHCGISPTPSSLKTKEIFNQNTLLPQGDIYELGVGWGGMALHLARRFPERQVIGYELSPIPFLVATIKSFWVPNLTIYRKDFLTVSHEKAGLIYCYLCREGMKKLKEKWEKEKLANCHIFTNTFAIPDWEPAKVFMLKDLFRTKILIYET